MTHASAPTSTTTVYVHDLSDRIIAELNASGQTLREYVWLDDMPVAVVDNVASGNPVIYYVHVDHLMRPARMTAQDTSWVWDVIYAPFGGVSYIWSNPANIDLRFPGQWFQLESGLAYNWHRHYDATLGRYVQPDSLGLTAMLSDGPSVYGYATQNPAAKVDPSGEIVPILVGIAAGVAIEAIADFIEKNCTCGDGSDSGNFASAAVAGGALGDSISGLPYPRGSIGGSAGQTSRLSSGLSKLGWRLPWRVWAPTWNNVAATTTNVGRAFGRWALPVSAGYFGYDLYRIARCLSK